MTWRYLEQLLLHIQFYLPGVFQKNMSLVVNGSLWTIPIEVRWYGILLLAGILGLFHRRRQFLLLALVSAYAIYIYGIFDVQHNPKANFPLPDFGCEYGCYFCYGAALYCFRKYWRPRALVILCLLALFAVLLVAINHAGAAVYVLLPFLVIWFGSSSTPVLRRSGRYGDFSFGIYIYAYMMQQWLIAVIGFNHSYGLELLASVACTLGCAILSWHLVEFPAMRLKRQLGRINGDRLRAITSIDAPASYPDTMER
jgi:peptidoglycan/LPS O-acetylase OafA/YrhL